MMITVNGKVAALKKGTSFEYISENRYFTGSDSYTLTISFPLRGCAQNIAIFGNINRTDVDKNKVVFNCEIRDGEFCKSGSIAVTEINDVEVKAQFLEGRSEQNFNATFDDVYINELDLGQWPSLSPQDIAPSSAWLGIHYGQEQVALPWVNDASGNIQNEVRWQTSKFVWAEDTEAISWQPYLIIIAKRICAQMGYSFDFSAWEQSDYRFLLICNTLPAAWEVPGYARALPHWTVSEFFEKLEFFLNCEFDIDHRGRHISFAFSKEVIDTSAPVELQSVVNAYTAEIAQDDAKCEYREAHNITFGERGDVLWKFESCRWLVQECLASGRVIEYASLREMIAANSEHFRVRSYAGMPQMKKLLHARDVDTYFVLRAYKNAPVYETREVVEIVDGNQYISEQRFKINEYHCCLQPVNQFGEVFVGEDAPSIELDFVPVRIDELDENEGNCMFLSFSSYAEPNPDGTRVDDDAVASSEEGELIQPYIVQELENGEQEKSTEYYSKIFVAFWDGAVEAGGMNPHPYTDSVIVRHDGTIFRPHYSLRINRPNGMMRFSTHRIDTRQTYTFSFLAGSIPDVRAVFHINGKRYLAEKITATFTAEAGMSQLLKGTFRKIIE